MSDVLQRIRLRMDGSNHWDGCQTEHVLCAAEAEIATLRDQLTAARHEAVEARMEPQRATEQANELRARVEELEKDKERLDWLLGHHAIQSVWLDDGEIDWLEDRAAIDAARKGDSNARSV